MKGRYLVLDLLKFMLAIIIVVYHYNYFNLKWENNFMFRGGYLAVDIFFIISGFYLNTLLIVKI